MGFRQTVGHLSHLLGWFLVRQTSAPPVPRLILRTVHDVPLDPDTDTLGVFRASVLPPDVTHTIDGREIAAILRGWPEGYAEGGAVVVVYETGLGRVAARARVERAPNAPA